MQTSLSNFNERERLAQIRYNSSVDISVLVINVLHQCSDAQQIIRNNIYQGMQSDHPLHQTLQPWLLCFRNIAQVLFECGKTSKANEQESSTYISVCERKNSKNASRQKTSLSKQAKPQECYKEFCYNHSDLTAFADKELSQTFKKAYSDGCFRDEIHYYFVPANSVRHEYRLLCQRQQNNVFDLLSSVYNDLNFKSKLIDCKEKGNKLQHLTLSQLRGKHITFFKTVSHY